MDQYVAKGIRVGDRIYDDAMTEGYDVTSVRTSKGRVYVRGVIPWVHRPHEKVSTSYRESERVSGYPAVRSNRSRTAARRLSHAALVRLLAETGRSRLRVEQNSGRTHYRLVRVARRRGAAPTPVTIWTTASGLATVIRGRR